MFSTNDCRRNKINGGKFHKMLMSFEQKVCENSGIRRVNLMIK